MNNGFDITSRPIGLSDRQMRFLENAMRAVPPRQRESFMQKVAAHLSASPSDDALAVCNQYANGFTHAEALYVRQQQRITKTISHRQENIFRAVQQSIRR